jgi:putative molybdopterin biosynthesis protein
MSVYLHDIPLPEALEHFRSALEAAGLWRLLEAEKIPLDENALGRVLAEPVWARISSPHYHASAMDGFAVRAAETAGAGPSDPVTLQTGSSARYVDTGDALPEGFDSVIPIENVEALDDTGLLTQAIRHPSSIRIRLAVAPWHHVRPLGEDIVATQLVLPMGHLLRPADLGAIAASGHVEITVARKPRVGIIPTGTELVSPGSELKPGDILEYNSIVMAAQLKSMGAEPRRYPITPDDFDLICQRVRGAAAENDLVLLNAGSSAGAEDFSAGVVRQLGTLLAHGVAVRPGHPVILGLLSPQAAGDSRQVPIIGVPGYPVSAALTVDIFAQPLLMHWQGRPPVEPRIQEAALTRKIVSPGGDDDYVRVVLGSVDGRMLAAPLARGAGVITSLSRADGIVVIPRGEQGAEAGQPVKVQLFGPPADLDSTIFCIGSHDVILDLLAQFLAGRGRRFVSSNVGSQGGLLSLRRGESHLAGSHLLDPRSGEYNLPYLRKYLGELPVKLVTLVHRQQGLLVLPSNPKSIRSIEDLRRADVRFVNRQRGAGTRLLLDYLLDSLGIPAEQILGYNQEEYTHLAVAAAVASGRADCGLGIAAAAQALGLDFLPLFQERYDFVIPARYWSGELLAPLFETLADPAFRSAVAGLPGYDVSHMGEVLSEE